MDTHSNTEKLIKDMQSIADQHGVLLDTEQLHIGGERAVMSPHKYVLTGHTVNDNTRVVFKCAKHKSGVAEMKAEHTIRNGLADMPFAEQDLLLPKELFFGLTDGSTISITEFIEQTKVMFDYSLAEQFFMVLQGLEAQESFHATTREHRNQVTGLFPTFSPQKYIQTFKEFSHNVTTEIPNLTELLSEAKLALETNTNILNTFDGYLMHSDFVPHNFRIKKKQLVLLDSSSFHFGNKYESWARLINFMEIHNPKLVPLLLNYIRNDRGENEYKDLQLMRIYKIGFLLNFYVNSLAKTDGNFHELTKVRITFWTATLKAVLSDTPVNMKDHITYVTSRDRLRTNTEKKRQREFTHA